VAESQSNAAEPGDAFERFARAGLDRLELEASADEFAVMTAVDGIYRAQFEALLGADLEGVEPEAHFNPSRAP
jgi:hypothetical protein